MNSIKTLLLVLVLNILTIVHCYADKIYILDSPGYNRAEGALIQKIAANGHTMTVDSVSYNSLPAGFTSSCVDPVNGYDWLCFFGDNDFTALIPQIEAYLNAGGKVFYQYEVSCCTTSASSIATILSGLTGLSISPNANPYIALTSGPAWRATSVSCCGTLTGNAYKGLDGMPVINQFQATSNINGSSPLISVCTNFGFRFTTNDFTFAGSTHKGAIVGLGDINAWYDGGEPFWNFGATPINTSTVSFFFPSNASSCYVLPPGCVITYSNSSAGAAVANLGNDTTLCTGQTMMLNVTEASATYSWQDGTTAATYQVTHAGTYWVKVTTSCNSASDTIHVQYTSPSILNLGNDTTLCQGSTLTLTAGSNIGTYHWQNGSTASTFLVTTAGTYWLKVTNSCGSYSDTINVHYNAAPVANLGHDTTLCTGQTLTLNVAQASATYSWQDGSITPTFLITHAGTYWVKVTTPCNSAIDTIHVHYTGPSALNIGNDTTLCVGNTLTLTAGSNVGTYHWQNGSTGSTFLVTSAGTYWLKVTNSCGSFSDTIHVSYKSAPLVSLGRDTTICEGIAWTLNANTPNVTYTWQNGTSASTLSVTQAGTYWVRVTNRCGSGSDTVHIGSEICGILEMPNVFSPNGDGTNDFFKPSKYADIVNAHLEIYNRWGTKLFDTNDVETGWNGKFNGMQCSEGTYYWILNYNTESKQSKTLTGFLQLLK